MTNRLTAAAMLVFVPAAFAQWATSGTNIYNTNTGRVGIGGVPTIGKLHIQTSGAMPLVAVDSQTTGSTIGVYADIVSPTGAALYGLSNSTSGINFGVLGRTPSVSGYAVYGDATATTGSPAGVRGRTDAAEGRGVLAQAVHGTGANVGLEAVTGSQSGTGVWARATNGGGSPKAVHAEVTSDLGYAVYAEGGMSYFEGAVGINTLPGGPQLGVWAESGRNGLGVFALDSVAIYAVTEDWCGILGEAQSFINTDSIAVCGSNWSSDGGIGVLGSGYYGVYGETTGGVYGVWAQGDLGASGNKTFRIDHPLDPANKYLVHYSSEAPEPLNAYSGVVQLDDAGRAWVNLPDYFEELNRDPRYQLTPIGGPAPMLHIGGEVENNRFLIAGGMPGSRVSWRVEGVRNDHYVRQRGAPVEIDKGADRGRYLHPELFGQPAELGVHRVRERIAERRSGPAGR